jgi:nitrogen fixation/metabolism regulation signal transduction histidine kinase
MRYLIMVASIPGGAAALALAVLFTRRISAPVTALASGLAQVASGSLPPPLPVTSRDELGGVTRIFNAMIREIARGRVALEPRLADLPRARDPAGSPGPDSEPVWSHDWETTRSGGR